ncbi:TIGR03086 family metal-binding protein [Dactylosporangium cerinum]|uniref:TIGR03086 family metal-binding protein n=1 Tax=Dactylosporangium cerinum TaxID=1434730 RepID=A0ABV9VS10_9ACTN
MTTIVNRIDAALDMTGTIVDAITSAQLAKPSLCPGWEVRTELNHLVGGMRIFAAQLSGTDAGADHEADWLGNDPHRAYAHAAVLDRAAWHHPDALATTVHLSLGAVPGPMAALIHLTEVLVHGVDLAVATSQEHRVDQHQCKQLLAIMHSMDFDTFRQPGMFGAERAAPDDAPTHRGLLAFLGRDLQKH